MEFPRRGLPTLTLHDEGVESSQGTPERGRGGVIGGTARTNNVLFGVDQGVRYEVRIVSDDEEGALPSTPPLPSTGGPSSQLSGSEAVDQPGCAGQVNRCARKRKRKLGARDESIVSAFTYFSKKFLEVEKTKLKMFEQLMDKTIEHERKCREMMLQGQLEVTAIILEALKASSSSR